MQSAEEFLAGITIKADKAYLPAIVGFVRSMATLLEFDEMRTNRLETIVQEACLNVIQHAYDEHKEESFDILFLRRPGEFVVAIEDRGIPFDFENYRSGSKHGLGLLIMKAFADEVRYLNLDSGNRVELIKKLHYKNIAQYLTELDINVLQEAQPGTDKIAIRMMNTGDAVGLSRCVFRTYGYSYTTEYLYYPERIKETLESGLSEAIIGVNTVGEIIAHACLLYETPEDKIADLAQGIVDPRYRGRKIANDILEVIRKMVFDKKLYGMYSEAVTVHPVSQKTLISFGAKETGITFGLIPGNIIFRELREKREHRQSIIIMFFETGFEPQRTIYPPSKHYQIIEKIYGSLKLKRELLCDEKSGHLPDIPEHSIINIKIDLEIQTAYLKVTQFGSDLTEQIHNRVVEICQQRIFIIILDLPLSDPLINFFCPEMEKLGFFFSGIIPELAKGDILRLQFLNNIPVNLEEMHIVSEFGNELLNYINRCRVTASN